MSEWESGDAGKRVTLSSTIPDKTAKQLAIEKGRSRLHSNNGFTYAVYKVYAYVDCDKSEGGLNDAYDTIEEFERSIADRRTYRRTAPSKNFESVG